MIAAVPHLVVDISAHGYGHVGQTAPVVEALARRVPGLRITVRSAAPHALLLRRIGCEFRHVPAESDFGMVMRSAVEVDAAASAAAYRAFHRDWETKVARAAEELRALQADLLLADVPYLPLAAAHAAGVRAVAMSSLNWADVYRHYCMSDAAGAAIHAQILAAYNGAERFLKMRPAMDMADLLNAQDIAPVAQTGRNRRAEIAFAEKLVLVSMGGIAFRLPVERWPKLAGVHWLVPQAWGVARDDVTAFESLGMPFGDLLASSDAVLTKPGYGTFVEAACSGVPVLYVSRGDWPEEPCLVRWLERNGVCREVARDALAAGDFADALRALWATPKPPALSAGGAEQAAEILAGMLDVRRS